MGQLGLSLNPSLIFLLEIREKLCPRRWTWETFLDIKERRRSTDRPGLRLLGLIFLPPSRPSKLLMLTRPSLLMSLLPRPLLLPHPNLPKGSLGTFWKMKT